MPGVLEASYGLPVLKEGDKDYTWPRTAQRQTAPLDTSASTQLAAGLPDGFDAASCPSIEDLVGATSRTDPNYEITQSRFFFAGQVVAAQLWRDYPETLYDIAVLAPYAGRPSEGRSWYQYYRANGDPLGLSGEPLGYGFALEPGKILLIAGTAQNSESANGSPDQLPYELVDG